MVHLTFAPFLVSFLCIASLWAPASAKRPFNRRSDFDAVPSVSDSGYEVPLDGSETCASAANCNDPGSKKKDITDILFPRHFFATFP